MKLKTEDLQSENDILQAKTVTSDLDDSSVADLASKHAILKASIKVNVCLFVCLSSFIDCFLAIRRYDRAA